VIVEDVRGSEIFAGQPSKDVLIGAGTMSAFGTKRTSELAPPMSAFGGKADIAG
jgi:hypothetical protein